VADGRHVRPGLVHFAVDEESGRVGRARAVASDDFALEVDRDHVAGLEKTEVATQR